MLGRPAPTEVEALYGALEARGFSVIESREGGMGGFQANLRSGIEGVTSIEVQFSSDRGQWTVGLRAGEMSRFIDPRVWEAYLDGKPVPELNLARSTDFVRTRLDDVLKAATDDPGLEVKLVKLGEDHMRRKLGL